MDKEKLKRDIGLLSIMAGYTGDHMKFEGGDLKRVVTDEEMTVFCAYSNLALAIAKLSEAIDELPD